MNRLAWMAVGVVLGCGAAVDDPDETGNSDGGSSTPQGAETGGMLPPPGRATSGVDGSSSSGGPEVCAGFDDEAGPDEGGTIEVRNVSGESILLETNCGRDYLTVRNQQGWEWPGELCLTTCEQQFEFGCNLCDGCATDSYTIVNPGGSLMIEWPLTLYETESPPLQCASDGSLCDANGTCSVRRNGFEGGAVNVRIAGIRQAACEAELEDPAQCICAEGLVCDAFVPVDGLTAAAAFETTVPVDAAGMIVVEVTD